MSTGLELLNVGARVMGALHEEYLHQLREDTRRGLLGRAKANLSPGGTPYGYRTEAIGGEGQGSRVVIHQDEAATVRLLVELYLSGAGLREVAHQLNAQGIPSPRARALRDRRPSWAPNTIREMLRNPVYVGRSIFNRTEWIKDHETGRRRRHARPPSEWVIQERPELAIIDADTFERVQAETRRRAGRRPRKADGASFAGSQRGHTTGGRHLLSGLLECGVCAGGFHALNGAARYGCSWRRARGSTVCTNDRTAPRLELEGRILAAVAKLLTPEVVTYAAEQTFQLVEAGLDQPAPPDPRLTELEFQLEVLRQLGQQGRAVAHLVAELEAERARLAEPARPAPVDLDQLRPVIEARVREMRAAFEVSPDDCRAAFRADHQLLDHLPRQAEPAVQGLELRAHQAVLVLRLLVHRPRIGTFTPQRPKTLVSSTSRLGSSICAAIVRACSADPTRSEARPIRSITQAVEPRVAASIRPAPAIRERIATPSCERSLLHRASPERTAALTALRRFPAHAARRGAAG